MVDHLVLYVTITGMNMMLKSSVGNWDTHPKACYGVINQPVANLFLNRFYSGEKSWVWKWIGDDCFG